MTVPVKHLPYADIVQQFVSVPLCDAYDPEVQNRLIRRDSHSKI